MSNILRESDYMKIGANGGLWVAPTGTAQPTGLDTDPADPWTPAGAVSDDGLVYGFDESSTSFTPWGLTSATRTVVTQSQRTFQLTLWETGRPIVRSIMYRIPVEDLVADPDGAVSFAETASPVPDRRAFLVDVYDGDAVERFYVPEGEVSNRDNVTFKQDTMSGYSITVTAYPDASGNTVYHLYTATVSGAAS